MGLPGIRWSDGLPGGPLKAPHNTVTPLFSTDFWNPNNASAASQLATLLRARSLLSENYPWMDSLDWDSSAYLDEA